MKCLGSGLRPGLGDFRILGSCMVAKGLAPEALAGLSQTEAELRPDVPRRDGEAQEGVCRAGFVSSASDSPLARHVGIRSGSRALLCSVQECTVGASVIPNIMVACSHYRHRYT